MAMKPAELQKYNALKLVNRMKSASAPERFGGAAAAVPDRREQRRLDQARGLVPFAVKLEGGLVKRIHEQAQERGVPLNDLVADLLRRALDAK
jgi:hypothetical protein